MPSDQDFGADSSTYANIFTFLGFPLERDLGPEVDAVVMGVPYDLATSGRAGARFGPSGIRQAAAQLRWEKQRWPWSFALADGLKAIDYGDLNFDDGNSNHMTELVSATADKIIASGARLLTLGGDHFVTLPLLRAVAKHHGPLALLHFDAHTDNERSDLAYYHGAMFYHAPREGLIDPDKSIQLGIRTEYDRALHPFTVLDADWTNNHPASAIVEQIRAVVGDAPVYLSFDIDCLDPAFAPGTGTPVAGGLSVNKIQQIIRSLRGINIVAMDMMEVAPAYDHAEITSLAAATIALDMLYLIAANARDGN